MDPHENSQMAEETVQPTMEDAANLSDPNPNGGNLYDVDDGELGDETPVFIKPGDAVEVVVDDDDVPMDEDDEDGENDNGDAIESQSDVAAPVVDMSRVRIASHAGPVYAVSSHPTSEQLLCVLSGGGDDKAFLHSVGSSAAASTTAAVRSIGLSHPYSDTVSCVALNLPFVDDKTPPYAATGCFDGSIVIYSAESGRLLQTLEGPSDVEFLTFHPKGGSVLLAGSASDATLWMFHIPLNRCLQVFVGHESSITCGGFSPDGRWVLSGSADGTLRVWAPRTGAGKHVFRFQSSGNAAASPAGITCMSMGGEDQQLVMVGTEDGQAHVCHIGTKKVVASLRHYQVPPNPHAVEDDDDDDMGADLPMSVEAVGFSPSNPHWCATGGVDGVLRIWDLTTGQCRQVCQPPPSNGDAAVQSGPAPMSSLGGITRLCWHPTPPAVVTCTTLGSIHVWDARNGQLLHTATGHTDVINDMSITFHPLSGSATVVTAGEDRSIRVFELDASVFSGTA